MREKKNVVVKFRDNQKMRKKAVLWLNLIYCEYFFFICDHSLLYYVYNKNRLSISISICCSLRL